MIKADIINKVAEEATITKVKAVEAVEAVFEGREDVAAVRSDSLPGPPIDFPIGGGETPTQPGPPTDIPIGGGETPPQN